MTTEPFSVAQRLGGDDFLAQAFGRTYLVARGEAASVAGLISWDDLNSILARHRLDAPRFRLAADGEPVPSYRYTQPVVTRRSTVWQRLQPDALHQQLAAGATLVLDAVDELHPGLHHLAAQLERWLRTSCQINLYASWTGTEGFGTHWDDHDVVVVQLDGAKRWRLYGPTRTAPMHRDVEAPEPPPSEPVADLVLAAGDVLYLPRGWWHAVAASEGQHSLHVTCGLQSHSGADLITWLSETLRAHEGVRAEVPRLAGDADQRAFVDELRKLLLEELDSPDLVARFAAARDATESPRLAPSLPFVNGVPPQPDLLVRLLPSRPALSTDSDGNVHLVAGGEDWTLAAPVLPLLEQLADGGQHRLALLADRAGLTLTQAASVVTELVNGNAAALGGNR
ncbi:cupin domain-containing protein [Streptacidiphilus rugosus]|uniref:cupin domain-containing protein n=1 Tax=Streptacidiphilus rugosus TaxID=405783 RepID=UPI0005678D58|nr:cupin domain-containing protein [Streptacidiphilus rugosus]